MTIRLTIVIDEQYRTVTTTLPDGAVIVAAPNMDEESISRARSLGYTDPDDMDAVWQMTKDHERLHHLLAEAEGLQCSIALWYAAHPDSPMDEHDRGRADREERVVLLIQRLLNQRLDSDA
jgi:hypothetical protein